MTPNVPELAIFVAITLTGPVVMSAAACAQWRILRTLRILASLPVLTALALYAALTDGDMGRAYRMLPRQ